MYQTAAKISVKFSNNNIKIVKLVSFGSQSWLAPDA